ncbi:hypothetical protein GCM10010246_61670 [Streptomyces cuspidosporus]|uniref:Uncharacterized protein n=1 Tax=Streptomyces cuspidosporus TaxID=66882 RepID=A0ABP5TUX7_9ACTN
MMVTSLEERGAVAQAVRVAVLAGGDVFQPVDASVSHSAIWVMKWSGRRRGLRRPVAPDAQGVGRTG